MLRIVWQEISYQKRIFWVFLAFTVLVCAYEVAIDGTRIGYVLIAIYGVTILAQAARRKENRDNLLSRLPLATRQIAGARISMIGFACLSMSSTYFLTYLLFHFQRPEQPMKLLAYSALMLIVFSLYYIVRDLTSGLSRQDRFRKIAVRTALMFLVLALNVVTIYAIVQTKATGKVHLFLDYLDKINLIAEAPLSSEIILIFFMFSLVLAMGSIETFRWRKSYID